MIYVVGSGPAGVSVAAALLEHGQHVTMLDAGRQLEPERQRVVSRLSAQESEDWAPEDVATLKEGMAPSVRGIPQKLVYGSDFPYRGVAEFLPTEKCGVDTESTFAEGGLSNVWGSAMLSYRADDLVRWPIGLSDLEEHYRAVLSMLDISGARDGLADLFPLYAERTRAFEMSSQARMLLQDMTLHREALQTAGVLFGQSRVALRSALDGPPSECAYCGLCMYGCPYNLLYNSSSTLRRLLDNPRFHYIRNVVVQRVRESGQTVFIEACDATARNAVHFAGERVCLACGPFITTRVLLESLEAYERPTQLADSQYFLFPLLRFRRASGASAERLHTLSQLFLEIVDEEVSRFTVHMQLYTYNDLYLGAMRKACGPAFGLLRRPVYAMLERMLIVQGFLHSDLSPGIEAVLARPRNGTPGVLVLQKHDRGAASQQTIRRVLHKIGQQRRHLRAMPLAMMLQIAPPGRSFHSGGSFPMRQTPVAFESDTLGRPWGLHRVHAVDSTVFPCIPATTITFSVMANAFRIGCGISGL
jgi:ferredoxin